jgi:HlyD family secretion protein
MPLVQERLFRSAALGRISSPEGLDALMEITTVRGWIAFAGLASLVVGGLVWGIVGRVPQVVSGQGIMVRQGGVFRIQAKESGQLDSVLVKAGDSVRQGQVIALLAQPGLRRTIDQVKASLSDLEGNRKKTADLLASNKTIELESIRQQQKQADEAVKVADQQIEALNTRILNEASALKQGLLTPDVAQATIAQRAEAQLSKMSTIARKQELSAREVQLQVTTGQTLFTLEQEIRQTQNHLDQLEAQLRAAASVGSPYDGIVVERLTDPGQSVEAGAPIVTVEASHVPLQVLMFIPLEGKRIERGMRVEMVPGGVRPEETGYFLGTVRTVSAAPISGSGLDRFLKNDVLVQQFTSEGGAYLIEIDPTADTSTVSKYKWTSRKGAPIAFGSGTLLKGKIVVKTEHPIALVIPALKRWIGG